MNLRTWLLGKEIDLQRSLTEEAVRVGIIKPGEQIVCMLRRHELSEKKPLPNPTSEIVYPADLTEEDRQKILSCGLRPQVIKMIRFLLSENPKKDTYPSANPGERGWYNSTIPMVANKTFRNAGLPWRVKSVGPWNDRTVYLATTVENGRPAVGRVWSKG
jgi:hypothetical protein